MSTVSYSSVLTELMEYAKRVSGKVAYPLTAEAFVVSVIDCINGTFSVSEFSEFVPVSKFFSSSKMQLNTLRELLMAHIIGDNESLFADEIYMRNKISSAEEILEKNSKTELTPEFLMRCILDEPSDVIDKAVREALGGGAFSIEDGDGEVRKTGFAFGPKFEELINGSFTSLTSSGAADALNVDREYFDDDEDGEAKKNSAVLNITKKAKSIRTKLLESVFGQDHAISVFTAGYFRGELLALTDKKRTRPRATFLFAGPPGVGKTFLAEQAAAQLGLPFRRFDMSEYSDKEANLEFCGSDKVYKNGAEGNVTGFVEANPRCVLLFDEVEKAHQVIINLFLQMLDAGRLRDNFTDREVSFKDTIIIFTTNAGRELYESEEGGDFSAISRKVILKALQTDVNPVTGKNFFPAAICSRFASGNVIMFNHIGAHNLRSIAKKELLRHAENFERELGIAIKVEDRVFTSILFGEGGAADARMIRARAESFFDDELFELFRLATGESAGKEPGNINTISIEVDIDPENKAVEALFESSEKPGVLVFADDSIAEQCREKSDYCSFLFASDAAAATELLAKNDVRMIILDVNCGIKDGTKGYLNIEDVRSEARDFFRHTRLYYKDVPIYVLVSEEHTVGNEEKLSYLRQGVRDTIDISAENFGARIKSICRKLHHQSSMNALAKANKIVTFETAQTVSEDGTVATITLFDFALETAVDSGDTKSVLANVSRPDVTFDKVIGAEDAKGELKYFVDYLKNPKRFLQTGVSAPKGILLYGPPGTGKTLLAKAMACESDVTFIAAEGNQFLKKYVGEGSAHLHELFRTARKYAPSILFIDEIDAIGRERGKSEHSVGSENTLTALLTEMDGFKSDPSKPVFVLAATNFDVEPGSPKSLDPALMRRFDRRIYIDLPGKDDRVKYMNMKVSANPAFCISDEKIDNLAIRSTGMSLAQLESILEMALRMAIRTGDYKVTDEVLDEAFETFVSGEEKKWDESLLRRVAIHEAGHAFVCWYHGEDPSYLTVVARGNHGGYMQHGDNEGKAIRTKNELLTRIRVSMAGRAAEMVYYGEEEGLSSGAGGDLVNSTRFAQRIICSYGMDEKFGMAVIDTETLHQSVLSDEVRAAVNEIMSEELNEAATLISKNRAAIDAIVELLLEKNHLSAKEIDSVFSANAKRPEKSV
ncbi:MAG: AAA family ATPase [Clostridia bacterium]|nr:AAA family ATPase [Clostridia bacterium]